MSDGSLFVVAGEHSGDLRGGALLTELQLMRPELRAFGMGGEALEAAGLERVAGFEKLSAVGLWEVAKVIPQARRTFDALIKLVEERKPSAALLIDFPEFNLRMARALKLLGVPVLYYVSPQIWAWRRGRLAIVRENVDRLLVLFGFEVDFYRDSLPVVHVGHPLVDEVPQIAQAWDEVELARQPERFRIALLPGSRRSEIARLLPILLATARCLQDDLPVTFSLIEAPNLPAAHFDGFLVGFDDLEIERVRHDRFSSIAASHLALCASGTATLEVGLLRTPMVVVYRVGLLSQLLGRLLVKVPFISLANLVLGHGVVPEFVQRDANPERVAHEARMILQDSRRREEMSSQLAAIREALGTSGASRRAAAEVSDFMAVETA